MDSVGEKRGSEVNLTSGCCRPVENVRCLSSLMTPHAEPFACLSQSFLREVQNVGILFLFRLIQGSKDHGIFRFLPLQSNLHSDDPHEIKFFQIHSILRKSSLFKKQICMACCKIVNLSYRTNLCYKRLPDF